MPGIAPFLRWAGSKRQIVTTLAGFWNDAFDRYVEPFVGSACLFFHLAPTKALLGDVNADLIETYRILKKDHPRVSSELRKLHRGASNYYKIRLQNPAQLQPTQKAARFIYLNRFCFNGLYRTNLSGGFNVPFGGARSGNVASESELGSAASLLRRASLKIGDFEKTLEHVRPGDFVYMDPPFSIRNHRVFKEYDPSVFNLEDVKRLRRTMEALADSKIAFVVSYLKSDEADLLRRGFDSCSVAVRRNISGFLGSRTICRELLISYAP